MIIYHTNTFNVCAVGERAGKYTLITAERREFYNLEGASCIAEGAGGKDILANLLSQHLNSQLAHALKIDENRISRIRAALGMASTDGGDRRSKEFQDRARTRITLPSTLQLIGHDRSQVIVIATKPTAWRLVPGTHILIEGRISGYLKDWVNKHTIAEGGDLLKCGQDRITSIRKFLGKGDNR